MYESGRRRTSFRKKLAFSLLPLLLAGVLIEVVGRLIFYQTHADEPFAILRLYESIKDKKLAMDIEEARQRFEERRTASRNCGEETQADYMRQYESIFGQFVEATTRADAQLLVMFLPAPGGPTKTNLAAREFFARICQDHDIPLLDLSDEFANVPKEQVYLLPENGHTSRLGNHLIAAALQRALKPMLAHRSSVSYSATVRPKLLGDLQPSRNYIFWKEAPLPCRVITNAQGLRRKEDLSFPKSDKVRVLCVGDSYTFGAAAHNPHCYPPILEHMAKGLEVVNAGIEGYTICDEYSYLEERGRFVEPDIVVLQVFPNDIDGFFPELQATYCRGGRHCPVRGELR